MHWKLFPLFIYICFKYKTIAAELLEKCAAHYTLKNHYIIDTKNSLHGGASFINVYYTKDARTCSKICCNLATCTVVVFEPNQQYKRHHKNCFAFDCGPEGSLCQFAPHNNFMVLISNTNIPSTDFLKSNYDLNSDKSFYKEGIFSVEKPSSVATTQTQPSQTTTTTLSPSITSSSIASIFAQPNPIKSIKPLNKNNLINIPSIDYDYQRSLYPKPEIPEDIIIPSYFYKPNNMLLSPKFSQLQSQPQDISTKNTTKFKDARYFSRSNIDILYNHGRKGGEQNDLTNIDVLHPYAQFLMPNQNYQKFYQPQEIMQSYVPRGDSGQQSRMYPENTYLKEVLPSVNQQLYWPSFKQPMDNNLYDVRNGFNQKLSENVKLYDNNIQSNFPSMQKPLRTNSPTHCNPAYEFQCETGDPKCIAIYDVCDGISHCHDGSDEKNCPGAKSGIKMDSDSMGQHEELRSDSEPPMADNMPKTTIQSDSSIITAEPSLMMVRPNDKSRATLAFAVGLGLVFAAITITCLTCATRLVRGQRIGPSKKHRFYVRDNENCNGRGARARKPLLSGSESGEGEGGENGGAHGRLTEPGRVLADDADQLMVDGPDPLDLDLRYGTAHHKTVIMDPSDRKYLSTKMGFAKLASKKREIAARKSRVPANGTYTPTALYTG